MALATTWRARGGGRTRTLAAILALAVLAPVAPVGAESPTRGGPPKPVNGGDAPGLNFYLPERGKEPSMIGDFDGVVAVGEINGTGVATQNGVEIPMSFSADMRIMTGRYLDRDGNVHEGTFGFI